MSEADNPKPTSASPGTGARVSNAAGIVNCKHLRKRLIAKDEDAEYWECFDCGEIFEPGEDGGVVNLDGSLSDA
jgi:hypothetical protein